MIFVWTPNGGPLQYVGFGIFLLQILSNCYIRSNTVNDTFTMEPPMMWLTFAGFHLLGFLFSQVLRDSIGDSLSAFTGSPREFLPHLAVFVISTIIFLGFSLYTIHLSMDMTFDIENEGNNEEEGDIWFGSTFVIECVSFIVYFAIMFTFLIMMLLNWNRLMDDDYYATNDNFRDKNAMEEISKKVRLMPIEEYISEEDLRKEGTVSQIKKMLQDRGKSHLDHCLERSELVEELEKCRKFDDTCCICATAYEKGDPLKLWPKCGHQFHVECIDQWSYTFSTRKRDDHTPTCPLCKEPLVL